MANGVEVRGKRIRIYFRYQGEKVRESLDLDPSDENIAYAERMVDQINHEIRNNTFDYSRYFPSSKRLQANTVGHYLDLLLEIKKEQVANSTYIGYAGMANRYIRLKFGDRQMDSIDYLELETWRSNELARLASKTIKDTFSVLSMTYKLYRSRHPGATDPTEQITVKLPDIEDPDPFTLDEIDKILHADPGHRIQELNMIQFMLWTGPRVSEALPLAWEDVVDLDKGLIRFQRARVRGVFKATKTRRANRIIELLKPARESLQLQWKITGDLDAVPVEVVQRDNRTKKTSRLRFVFLNTNTERPHYNDFSLRDRFFRAHLDRAGVRYRGTNQCRHTFISQMLTATMPIEWIAKQTGTSVEMIRRRYGKWIDEDAVDMVGLAESRLNLK